MSADQRRAHAAVGRALARGDLVRQPCEDCAGHPRWPSDARPEFIVAHHDDYSRPLDVRWLCRTHHYAFHRARGDYVNQGSKSKEAWARRKAEAREAATGRGTTTDPKPVALPLGRS